MQNRAYAPTIPHLKQLVLLGGGHSHLSVIAALAMRPLPGLRVVLISRDTMTGYSGMLPGYIAGHYTFDETHLDLRRLAEMAGIVFIRDDVVALDCAAQVIHCGDSGRVHYDWLSVNLGSTPSFDGIGGALQRIVPVKPIQRFVDSLDELSQWVASGVGEQLHLGVVGAGAAGVEVLLSLQLRLQANETLPPRVREALRFHLLSASEQILPNHNRRVRACFEQVLRQRQVQVHHGFRLAQVTADAVISTRGEALPLQRIYLTTGASAQPWLENSGLALDASGFIRVSSTLQSVSHSNVFAAGDIAAQDGYPVEKAGVFAVRHGKPLAANIRNLIEARPLRRYRPQRQWLALLSTGDRYAVASRGRWFARGAWVWRWKDRIDRKFMQMYQTFTPMPTVPEPVVAAALRDQSSTALLQNLSMRCSGCGSKVGSSVLSRALAELRQPPSNHVVLGLDAPDDAALLAIPPGQLLVQSVDYFTAPVDDPLQLGKLAALHSLGDLHAMGAQPHSAQALVTLPLASAAIMEETLRQILLGAAAVFNAEGAIIVGGHTTEGQQLTLGFSVNGCVAADKVMRKQGMQPGERLILTKAIGSGVLFAAHHQLKAHGEWLDAALQSMLQSNSAGAAILQKYHASACTDVTGFGLLGHLGEMIRGQPLCLTLDCAAIPLLPGAAEMSAAGVRSSLYADNLVARYVLENLHEVADKPVFPLLFDPQTAGGLLASVPARQVDDCLAELRQLYAEAVCIGEVSGAAETATIVLR